MIAKENVEIELNVNISNDCAIFVIGERMYKMRRQLFVERLFGE
jgi:hypothetical protein